MTLRSALLAGAPLSAFAKYRRFIVYRLEWQADKGKYDKIPCNWHTAEPANAHDEKVQIDWETACTTQEVLGANYGVGFVLNANDGFWFLDIDNCLEATGWSPLATRLVEALPGAACEVSVSGKGLHIFGTGKLPNHACKNIALGLELYHDGRFVALTGTNVIGDASKDCTAEITAVVADYFPQSADAPVEWSDFGVPVEQDVPLLAKAMKSKSATAAFGSKATFAALWNADPEILGKAYPDSGNRRYDASSADMALAQHLAFWTRKDCGRIWRLMWTAKLRREKWDKRPDYVRDTILAACAKQVDVYEDKAEKKKQEVAAAVATLTSINAPLNGGPPTPRSMDDFCYYAPDSDYIFLKTGDHWKKEAIANTFGDSAPVAIAGGKQVDCIAWDPAEPEFITGRVMSAGSAGWIPAPGYVTLNTYVPSPAKSGDAAQAGPWLDQVKRLFPEHWQHLVNYFAFKVQHPGVKINHAIVMGGPQGVGKDSVLAPVEHAIGRNNFKEVIPSAIFGDFTPWTRCVFLRINEAHDLGDGGRNGCTRTQLYERLKIIVCAPPDTLLFNDKHVKAYPVANVCGTVITTNHETGAIYLPPDDRRYFVVWTHAKKEDFTADQWNTYWKWYLYTDGAKHVTALLRTWDLSGFNPKAEPIKTAAWEMMVAASVSDGDMELADALDGIKRPNALTLDMLRRHVGLTMSNLREDLHDRKKSSTWPARMAKAGYTQVRNGGSKDGYFAVGGVRMPIYVNKELGERDRGNAADELVRNYLPKA